MNVVLVIAEDRAIYEALQAALQETDLVLIEPSVDDALRRLIGVKADVVIVDDAPALGPRALAQIAEAAPSTPILALSARSDADGAQARERAFGEGIAVPVGHGSR